MKDSRGAKKQANSVFALQRPTKYSMDYTAGKTQAEHVGWLQARCAGEKSRGLLHRNMEIARSVIFSSP